jgi:hypothetical protein
MHLYQGTWQQQNYLILVNLSSKRNCVTFVSGCLWYLAISQSKAWPCFEDPPTFNSTEKNSMKSNQFFLFSCCILKWYVWKNGHGEHLYQPTFGYRRYSQITTKLMWRKLCTDWVYRVYCVHKLLGHGSECSFLFSLCKMVTVKELRLQHSTMDSGASIFFSILHPYARVTQCLV